MVSEQKSDLKSLGSKRTMPVQSRPPAPISRSWVCCTNVFAHGDFTVPPRTVLWPGSIGLNEPQSYRLHQEWGEFGQVSRLG